MFQPSAAQRAAIRLRGASLLVSAGAGSGKTAVLAQRCACLAAELRPPCPIEHLLVVTFTDAAAAEMRQRIGQALRDRLAETPGDRWLQRQLALLETAQVSTIHSFCRQVLNRYFAQAELDPQAPVMDAHDALLLRQETARQVFDRYAEREDARGQAYLDLLAAYGGSGEQPVIERALAVSAFLESLPNPDEWINETRRRYGSDSGEQLPEFWAERLADALREELDEQDETVAAELAAIGPAEGPVGQVAAALEEYRRALDGWRGRMWHRPLAGDSTGGTPVPQGTIQDDCLQSIREYVFAKLPRKDAKEVKQLGDEGMRRFEAAKQRATRVRDKLFQERLLGGYGRFTAADWAEGIARTRPHVETFLTLVSAVRKAYREAKRELGAVDFADLERMTLDLLRDDGAGVAARLRNQYEHVLVDEFQDTSPIQAEILRLVSREGEVREGILAPAGEGILAPAGEGILAPAGEGILAPAGEGILAPAAPARAAREGAARRAGNLFAVGDVKQSIYRFRLAEPRLFLTRLGKFERLRVSEDGPLPDVTGSPGAVIDLAVNYRSKPAVLEAVNAVFERVMAADLGGIPYDEAARLKPGPKKNEPPAPSKDAETSDAATSDAAPSSQKPTASLPWASVPVELHVLEPIAAARGGNEGAADSGGGTLREEAANGGEESESTDAGGEAWEWEQIQREAYVIAARIKELVAGGTPHKDIAVLLRSMKPRSELLLRTLSQLGVPAFADSSGGFFEALEVLDLRSLLETLDNEQQDIPLAAVLRSPLFGPAFTDDELVEIRTHGGRAGGVGHNGASGLGRRVAAERAFHEAVCEYARSGSNEALRARLAAVLDQLHDWRQRLRRRPIADVLWEIYQESGYLAYVDALRDGRQRRANLLRLHEYTRQFGAFRRQGLSRFLRFMSSLEEAGEDLDAGSVALPSEDVVRVMTIHRAKGLEFPVVIVGELGKRFNMADARGAILFDRRLGVAMNAVDVERRISYPTLPHRLVSRAAEMESLAEELRVLYVALTRAKEKLILVGTGPLTTLERDRQRYAGLPGVVPMLDRRTAQGMLDWVRAAVCCQKPGRALFGEQNVSEGASEALFAVRVYDAAAMSGWALDPPQARGVSERLEQCARMQPLKNQAAEEGDVATVQTVIQRLTTKYPATELTRVPAVMAASMLKRRWEVRQDEEEPAAAWRSQDRAGSCRAGTNRSAGPPWPTRNATESPSVPDALNAGATKRPTVSPEHLFRAPAFVGAAPTPEPTKVGTWTHEFLQRLDLARPCDASDLRGQLDAIALAGVLAPAEAAAIDVEAAAWFFAASLGVRLRDKKTRVYREWPFVMGVDPRRYDERAVARDARDLMLVRGIIDCLFDAGEGWEILDYKTDAVSGEALAARAEAYAGQLRIYAAAAEAVWRQPISRGWLVFLAARQVVEVECATAK